METQFYFYDSAHSLKPYAYSLPGLIPAGGEKPDDSMLAAPRLGEDGKPLPGEWPVANATLDGWDYVEDHRQRKDERDRIIEGTGTPYWLVAEGDAWQSPARYMTDIGPLPPLSEGAVLTRPEKPQEDLATDLRSQRDSRIAATDYLMAADYPLDDAQREAWAVYRQALRDMPQAEGFPWDGGGEATPWPVQPE